MALGFGLSLIGFGSGASSTPPVQLVIAFGESNSGGYAPNGDASAPELASRSQVQMWNVNTSVFENLDIGTNNNLDHAGGLNSTTHGIELELANAVAAGRFNESTVYYVQTGQGGSQIAEWAPGHASGYWTKFLARTQAARAALTAAGKTPVITVFYTQGINDSIGYSTYQGGYYAGQTGSAWRSATNTVISNIQAELGPCRIVMTKFRLPTFSSLNSDIDTVVSGLTNAASIKTPEVGGSGGTEWQSDGNHWTYAGYKTLCNLFIDEMLANNGQVASPSISPAAGTYGSSQTVTISGTGTFKYQNNNTSDPHIGTTYSGTFSTGALPSQITARAIQRGKKSSAIVTVDYSDSSSTFDTTDITNGNFTATNFNRTIVNPNPVWRSCRTSTYKSSGKSYIEFYCTVGTGNAFCLFGFASAGFSASNYPGTSNYSASAGGGGAAYNSGFNSVYGADVGTTVPSTGQVYALALDYSAGKAYIAKNNTWLNSSDPVAGTNPSFTFTPGTVGPLAAVIGLYQDGATWRLQPTSGTQTYSPPSGFSVWG